MLRFSPAVVWQICWADRSTCALIKKKITTDLSGQNEQFHLTFHGKMSFGIHVMLFYENKGFRVSE